MKTLLIVAAVLLCASVHAQQYRYVRIITVQAGVQNKDKADFFMPDAPDSAKYYTSLKITDILEAVQLMEKKGYELVSITPSAAGSVGVMVTTAYMRRRKQ